MNSDRKIEDARDAVKKDDRNSQGREVEFADPVKFLSSVAFSELPETPVLQAQLTVTTLDVLNIERLRTRNTGAVTVTDLLNGQEGQQVSIRGDGFTTLAHNTNIRLNTGANKLLAADQVYILTRINSQWVEHAGSVATTYSAGTGLVLTGTTFSNPYVGKHITCLASSASVTISAGSTVHVGATGRWSVRADATGMNNIRISSSIDGAGATGNHTLDVYYSTNAGGSWTLITVGAAVTNAGLQQTTATVALPAGAKNAATWFAPAVTSSSTTGTTNLYTFSVELTP
jgi:hypothetical protein